MKRFISITILLFSFFLLYNADALAVGSANVPPMPNTLNPQFSAGSPEGLFYDSLRPYGEWVWVQPNGWCWYPYNMPIDWRPYTNGYWAYTDYGWTWCSDEPWGWACFHYGTWDFDISYGWLWCPGTIWSPAWVVWRCGGDWIGWAPCPTRFRWHEGRGFDLRGVDLDNIIPRHEFCFVDIDHFSDEHLRDRILPVERNVGAFHSTRASLNIDIEKGHIVNHLPVQGDLEKRLGHPIQRFQIVNSDTITFSRPLGKNNQIPVFRPDAAQLVARHNEIIKAMNKESAKVPAELVNRQEAERRALQEQHDARMRNLEAAHQQELNQTTNRANIEQLQKQHEQERAALQEETQRESQLLQNYHQRERNFSPPGDGQSRRFIVPSRQIPQCNRYPKWKTEELNAAVAQNNNVVMVTAAAAVAAAESVAAIKET